MNYFDDDELPEVKPTKPVVPPANTEFTSVSEEALAEFMKPQPANNQPLVDDPEGNVSTDGWTYFMNPTQPPKKD